MQFLVQKLGLSLFLLALALSTSDVTLAARLDLTCKSAFIRFQTRFEFESFDSKFKNVSDPVSERDILRNWLTAKIPSSLQDARFFEVLNSEGTWESEGWSLQILQYEDLVDGMRRKLFGVKLQHPDRDYADHRHWIVDAILSEIEGGKPSFSIKLRTIESIDQFMKKPQFSVPAFVSQLIQLGEASSGFLPLHYDYLKVSPAKIDRFVEALEDPQRELPIIFVSKTLQNEWLVSPSELSKRFLGRAIVMAEALNDETGSFVLVDHLKEKMPKELLAFGGAIRIYRPRVKSQSLEDRSRHPYVTPETIAARSSWELLNILEAQLERSGVVFVPNAIEKIEDIENLKRNVLLSNLDKTDPKKIEELSANNESLHHENQSLRAEIAGLKKQREGVDVVLEELQQEHLAELSMRDAELEELRDLIRQWQAGNTENVRIEADSPQSLGEMLEQLEASLSDRIEFSSNAHTSALRYFERREDLIPVIAKLIRAMNDHLWPILFPDPNGPVLRGTPAEIFRRASGGLEISFRESQQTRNMSNFAATRNVTHNAKVYVGEAHLKWNKGKDFIRIHFQHDQELKKIILTHIVDHLPVSTSKKSGGRR